MAPNSDEALQLVVFLHGRAEEHTLEPGTVLTIGRAEGNAVRIDDASVSRKHAQLRYGPPLQIEDTGSVNGIRVRASIAGAGTEEMTDVRLETGQAVEITPGDAIALGAATLVVRRIAGAATDASHGERRGEGEHDGEHDGEVIVRDPLMRSLHAMVRRVAASPISVLFLGETGVGKEVFAQAVHRHSPRAKGPFLGLNCGALTESLLESELFGHEKGAFTGATQSKPGLFESAEGGTVFLDEIGEMPMSVQVKLLRVIETRTVMRVGGLKPRPIDVRFVAATHRDLEREVERGTFRQDLYFRLNGISLRVPPLRDRRDEIAPLARRFAAQAALQMGREHAPVVTDEALRALEAHRWPGNVRELRNVMERAVVLGPGDRILAEHLLLASGASASAKASQTDGAPALVAPDAPPAVTGSDADTRSETAGTDESDTPPRLRHEIEALERQRIIDALARCAGNQTQAAAMLGISRRTLVTRLGAYEIPRPRKKP